MESEFFLNAGITPPSLHVKPTSTSAMPTWQSLSSAMEMQANEVNCSKDRSTDCFFNPNWEKSTSHSLHFESALSSIVSSPAASNSNISNESFMIRELLEKLGNIGSCNNNSGEISPHSQPFLAASYINNTGNNSTNTSCYSTPLNSPPKLNFPVMDQFSKENLNFPNLGKPLALNSSVAEFTADPGFAERAARFSCFGSRSFNGRTNQFGLYNAGFANRCNPLTGNGKLPRVSSSPSLKAIGSQKGNRSSPLQDRSELANSSQESSVSEQMPNRESGLKTSSELKSRKRKAVSEGKAKESTSTPRADATKDAETNANLNATQIKPNEENGSENSPAKAGEEPKVNGDGKQTKANSKPPEPPKDYIHVRARRGQATDSHSLAERVRREKISERMRLLQDLVPGCNRVTGKALMLDEIINYVQSLQRQVEFLSMKLASVDTRLDFNMDALVSKDIFQSNNTLPHPIFPLDSSASAIFGHQRQQNPPLHTNICNGTVPQCSVDSLGTGLCQNLNAQCPPLNEFNQTLPQYTTFCEDDLQTIVQMGFSQNPKPETALQPQNLQGSNEVSYMKIEL